jgi:hypothetical protein
MPPVEGDCIPFDGSTCTVTPPASGESFPPEGGSSSAGADAAEASSETEGGSCVTADTFISAPCAPCIAQFCCLADTACAGDDGCLALVQCLVSGQTCSGLTQQATTDFDDLTSCFNRFCAQACQSLASHDS